ncbi:MAG: hypothetical protein ABGY72_09450 [bacterium]
MGLATSCADLTSVESQPPEADHLSVAETFIDRFYAFDSAALTTMLGGATDSIPSIGFYQGWAEGGHYQVVQRLPCEATGPEAVSCAITVQDDLMLALGIDFNVTDTFELSFADGGIASVETSSNDLQVFWDAREWINEEHPELLRVPCRGLFDGGPTPGACIRAMVEGFAKFAASDDFPEASAFLPSASHD